MSIQTELTRLTNAKAAIKAAIEGKGVTVPDATLLDGMAALIESIQAGGGDGASTLWGGKFTTGSFVLAEETTSEYVIATSNDEAMLGLLNEGEKLSDTNVHNSIGLMIVRKPTSAFTGSNYAQCLGSSLVFPTHFGSRAGTARMAQYWDSYGTSRANNTILADVEGTQLSVKFSSSYKGSPDFTYQWLAWRAVI